MPVPLTAIRIPQSIPPIAPAASPKSPAGGEFQSILSEAVGQVEQFQQNSASTIDKFMSGEEEEVHKVALAVDQAQMAFDLFLRVRNKVISAYQEVMRMQM